MTQTKDNLIKALENAFAMQTDNGTGPLLLFKKHDSHFQLANIEHVADFILARDAKVRNEALEEVMKPLLKIKRELPLGYKDVLARGKEITFLDGIDEALATIARLKGGEV